MRIAVVSDWFSEQMGYSENCLPKALASLGHDVHLITSDAQVYFDSPTYAQTYEPFIGPSIVPTGVKRLDGYTLHRLPHERTRRGRLRIRGLGGALARLRPDVVQTYEVLIPSTADAAIAQLRLGYRLFLESHIHASVFDEAGILARRRRRLRWWLLRQTQARFINWRTELCYPISSDAAELAVRWFGISADKIRVQSLGVDTQLFEPVTLPAAQRARAELRAQLGYGDDTVVCIYTGRFAADKGPQVLAEAVELLVGRGEPVAGLFVGSGTVSEQEGIARRAGCQIQPFVPTAKLPPFYWAADIGVWPRQESTSQLDAAACGLPIIVSDRVSVRERIDGNGLTYREGSAPDLAAAILSLVPPDRRRQLGAAGSAKMQRDFSWRGIAQDRARDYEGALGRR